jgi:hypothetical protein
MRSTPSRIGIWASGVLAGIAVAISATAAPAPASGAIEIEGRVSAIDRTAASLTVLDKQLGAVTVKVSSPTVLRRGDVMVPFSEIQGGMLLRIKASPQADKTYLASEIAVQEESAGGNREASGAVASVNSDQKSFVLQTSDARSVMVTTDSTTSFGKGNGSASFSDVAAGSKVHVEGLLQPDNSILARKVTIE